MKLVVLLKMVPDVVEELVIGPDGKSLDMDSVRLTLNESDDHALEEALLLKERLGGTVIVVTLDSPEVDEVLYTAIAKGADRAVKITGFEIPPPTREAAAIIAGALRSHEGLLPADLILTGSQAIDDLDGLLAPLVAHELGLPYLGILTQITPDASLQSATVIKEFAGGLRGEFEIPLPAVAGVQSAEKPPRYVPVAKVRAAMKTAQIETVEAAGAAVSGKLLVAAMSMPEESGAAEMLSGAPDEVSEKLCGVLAERGLV